MKGNFKYEGRLDEVMTASVYGNSWDIVELERRARDQVRGKSDEELEKEYDSLSGGYRISLESSGDFRYSGHRDIVRASADLIRRVTFSSISAQKKNSYDYLRDEVQRNPNKLLREGKGRLARSITALELFLEVCKEDEVVKQYESRGLYQK